ncbi:MAG TPA: CHAD domain-containing protein [Steroidobacteraceae bacterium]|nr:CHAD domain-containing protein [Steroidobacteraceae bacterium]
MKRATGRIPSGQSVQLAVQAPHVQLQPDMPTAQALRLIVQACLRHLIANQAGVAAGQGEALHQMRLALRRLRVTLSLFAELAADRQVRQIKARLRELLDTLGPARDLDVVIEEFLRPLRHRYGGRRGLAGLCREFEERRARALRRIAAGVQGAKFRALYTDLATWVESEPSAAANRDIAAWAGGELARRRRRLKRAGRDIGSLAPAERHRLRIRAKKLRFAYESFACLASGRRRQMRQVAALAALRDLQSALGALSDIAQCVALMSGVARARSRTASASAARLVVAAVEARCPQLVLSAQESCDRFCAVKPFWEER